MKWAFHFIIVLWTKNFSPDYRKKLFAETDTEPLLAFLRCVPVAMSNQNRCFEKRELGDTNSVFPTLSKLPSFQKPKKRNKLSIIGSDFHWKKLSEI